MMIRRALLAPFLVALSLAPAPAAEAGLTTATCQGEPATIVGPGPDGQTLLGTDGPDVIVTDGAVDVDARGGDDLVCVTGALPKRQPFVLVDGAGDDTIHNLSPTIAGSLKDRWSFYLGDGDDRFVGGPSGEYVTTDAGADDIATRGGIDSVRVGDLDTDVPFAGRISLGAEGGELTLSRLAPTAVLDGGQGPSMLRLGRTFPGTWAVDNRTRTATLDGTAAFHWTGFTGFRWEHNALRFYGAGQAETLLGYDVLGAHLGGGADDVTLFYVAGDDEGRIIGGAGPDHLQIDADSAVRTSFVVYLASGRASYVESSDDLEFAEFESFGLYGERLVHPATLLGTSGPDVLDATGCDLVVRAGGGPDVVHAESDWSSCDARTETHGGRGNDRLWGVHQPTDRLYGDRGDDVLRGMRGVGGAGDDELRGTSLHDELGGGSGNDTMLGFGGRDLLDGQAGFDTARGGDGRDTCRAERRVSCELR